MKMSIESHRWQLLPVLGLAWVPKRLRLDLSPIACGKCGQKTVRENRVKKKGFNQGHIF